MYQLGGSGAGSVADGAGFVGCFLLTFALTFVDSNLDTKALSFGSGGGSGRGGRRLATSNPCMLCRPSNRVEMVGMSGGKGVVSAACAALPRGFALRIASRGNEFPFSMGLRPMGHPK